MTACAGWIGTEVFKRRTCHHQKPSPAFSWPPWVRGGRRRIVANAKSQAVLQSVRCGAGCGCVKLRRTPTLSSRQQAAGAWPQGCATVCAAGVSVAAPPLPRTSQPAIPPGCAFRDRASHEPRCSHTVGNGRCLRSCSPASTRRRSRSLLKCLTFRLTLVVGINLRARNFSSKLSA